MCIRDSPTTHLPVVTASGNIDLTQLLATFQKAVNCTCYGDYGFDLAPWDDNQAGSIVWNTCLLSAISFPNTHSGDGSGFWVAGNKDPTCNPLSPVPFHASAQQYDLWYDTTNNYLLQYYGGAWKIVQTNFSVLISATNGNARWDLTQGCEVQVPNQWTQQNKCCLLYTSPSPRD